MAFHTNDGNSRRQVEASEEAALASDLHEADRLLSQIDSISSPKPRRRRPHQRQGALSSNPNKREEGKWMLYIVLNQITMKTDLDMKFALQYV